MEENHPAHPVRILLAFPFVILVRAYRLVSPLKQVIFGPYARCRFHPTCSEYALECFKRFNLLKALLKTAARISRCNPLHSGGYDPVVYPEHTTPRHACDETGNH